MTDRDLMQQALEALENVRHYDKENLYGLDDDIADLRERLSQPEQEPVAWMVYTLDGNSVCVTDNPADFGDQHRALPLYTAPQAPRTEQPKLTDEEIEDLYFDKFSMGELKAFARAIESKLREKNT